jgi:phosphatidylglycerol:prolipoprotein diacylglycerol transferase
MLSAFCYGCGYLVGLLAFIWLARRRRLATSGVLTLAMVGLIGGLVGANLVQWLATGEAGKTVLGAIAGGYLAVVVAKRLIGLRRPLGDLFAVAICAGEAVGRWGCFFGGCCYGKPTHLPWAVWQHGAYRHPTQVYLSLASALILVLLLRYERASPPENALFYLQGALYCAARFGIEFWRVAPPGPAGLTLARWACLAGGAFFATRLALLRAKGISKGISHEALS